MIAIQVDDFGKLATTAKPEILAFFATAPQELAAAGLLDNPLRLCHFMAQVMTESAALRSVSENLNYSADRLKAVWPSRFPNDEVAAEYAHNPEKLANFVYGGRMGNADPGDGYKFRGRGLLQITGRENYTKLGQLIGVSLADNPDLATDPSTALKVAIGFWNNARYQGKTCNQLADADDVVGLTHAINGGTNGLEDRRKWLEKTKALWGAAPSVATPPVAPTPVPTSPSPPRQPEAAPQQQTQQPPAQTAPQQRGGTTFSAIIAFFTGAIAFISAIFTEVHNWLHEQRMALWQRIGFDPLWIVGAIFVLAIVWVIFVRVEHRGKVKKAAAGG
jgi:putative chitinase